MSSNRIKVIIIDVVNRSILLYDETTSNIQYKVPKYKVLAFSLNPFIIASRGR
jgi:hypothetical protein